MRLIIYMRTHITQLAVLLLVILLTPLSGWGAEKPRLSFEPGETLTYDVTWAVFPAGEVTSQIQRTGNNSHDPYTITTTARSSGFVSLLFNVNDQLQSFFNPQTLCSERITKKINEGRRHKDTLIVYDYVRHLGLLDERDLTRTGDPPKHAENAIPACVEDVVTAFYYLRQQQFEVGRVIELPVNDGSKTQQVAVEVQALEKVETPLGTFDAYRVEPKVFNNNLFKRKGRMLIWFGADNRHLPLRIKAMIAVGSITGTLRQVSNQAPAASSAR